MENNKNEMQPSAADENKKTQDLPVVERLCKFAFIMSTIGVLTIGVCPAFGAMGLVVGCVFQKKNYQLSPLNQSRLKKARIMAIVSFFFFVVDILLLFLYNSKIK